MKPTHAPWTAATLFGGLMTTGLLLAVSVAHAVDFAPSGFGTLGYAVSDRPYAYQRFIDDQGTFKRDTVLGGQLDVKFNSEWSATVQAMLAPSLRSDEDWSLTATWAFLSWRPNNDWLVRLGKQRVPIYLNSENRDVGQTYDMARLPIEMYGISPSTDFNGVYVSHSWLPDAGELTLDVFTGQAGLAARYHSRDMGVGFMDVRTTVTGSVLTLRTDASSWRLGLHHTITRRQDGQHLPSAYPYVDLGGGLGFYQVSGAGVGTTASIVNDVITLGGDVEFAPNWRLVSELARNVQSRTENGANTAGGYVALLHKMARFTPYVSYARLRSMGDPVRVVNQLDASGVPGFVPSADLINASQRIAADVVAVYDQDSVAIGTSYALTPQSKLKAEWMRTRIGNRSVMVDSPAGGDVVRRQGIQVLSLNYSFVF